MSLISEQNYSQIILMKKQISQLIIVHLNENISILSFVRILTEIKFSIFVNVMKYKTLVNINWHKNFNETLDVDYHRWTNV